MYERNAIVLERYFNQMFGYNMKNNLKTNFRDYLELVENLEQYRNVSEEEEEIMQEYDSTANKIREIQKNQETLELKNKKMQEERDNLFRNIDEKPELIQEKLDDINDKIQNLNEEISKSATEFVNAVSEFNEKTSTRTACERNRRKVESDYNKKLNETLDDYQNIDISYEKRAKQFVEKETENIEKDLKERIEKNGEKEKIPFDLDVISKAIILSIDIQKRETDIYANIYEKTNKLFVEIKNNNIKIDRHKKIIKDSKSKLEFIAAIKDYLIQFLDNERLTAVNGEEEHNKLMKEACKNLEEDLLQINNLYTLLLKEISKKVAKKSYAELYNVDYLKNLENKADTFDEEVKKLNLAVTVINPNHWRLDGMKKIYDVFYKNVTENYGRDLSEYIIEEKEEEIDEEIEEVQEEQEVVVEKIEEKEEENKSKTDKDDAKSEIDRKIDMILGFSDNGQANNSDYEEDDDWDDEDWKEDDEDPIWDDEEEEQDDELWDEDPVIEDEDLSDDDDINDDEDWEIEDKDDEEDWDNDEKDDIEDDIDLDIWGNSIKNTKKINDEEDEEDEDFWDDDEDTENEKDDEDEWEDEQDDEDTDNLSDISEEENDEEDSKKKSKAKVKKKKDKKKDSDEDKKQDDEDWENEFVKMDNKNEKRKRKRIFR